MINSSSRAADNNVVKRHRSSSLAREVTFDSDVTDDDSDLPPSLNTVERSVRAVEKLRHRCDTLLGRYIQGADYKYARDTASERLGAGIVKYVTDDTEMRTAMLNTLTTFNEFALASDDGDSDATIKIGLQCMRQLYAHIEQYKANIEQQFPSARLGDIVRALNALDRMWDVRTPSEQTYAAGMLVIELSEGTGYSDKCKSFITEHVHTMKEKIKSMSSVHEISALLKSVRDMLARLRVEIARDARR